MGAWAEQKKVLKVRKRRHSRCVYKIYDFQKQISAGKKNCISIEMENGSISMDISIFFKKN